MTLRVNPRVLIVFLAFSAGAVAWHSAMPFDAAPAAPRGASDRPHIVASPARAPSPAWAMTSPESVFLDAPAPSPSRRLAGTTEPASEELLSVIALRYGPAFEALALSPSAIEQLVGLLAERTLITRDVLNISRATGLTVDSDEPTLRTILATAQSPTDTAIQQLAGRPGFEAMTRCDEDLHVQSVVTELQQQLEHSGVPLREDRADALGQILTSTAPQKSDGRPDLGAITPAAVSRSWGILSQPQVTALERLQRR